MNSSMEKLNRAIASAVSVPQRTRLEAQRDTIQRTTRPRIRFGGGSVADANGWLSWPVPRGHAETDGLLAAYMAAVCWVSMYPTPQEVGRIVRIVDDSELSVLEVV